MRLDAAQDESPFAPPPNGAPEGSYRAFTVTSGGVDVSDRWRTHPAACSRLRPLRPHPGLLNTSTVQLDDASPCTRASWATAAVRRHPRSGGPERWARGVRPASRTRATTGPPPTPPPSLALARRAGGADARDALRLRLHDALEPHPRVDRPGEGRRRPARAPTGQTYPSGRAGRKRAQPRSSSPRPWSSSLSRPRSWP